ncbi:hypothetical protein [Mammaliicoccus sciuri]|uniref:hypothetical protein n=1 Tax=Mammaliicoccus sciuri TaxID=1296 RepID=UPI00289CF996|nr:hypothetical protein [Mammaliicoccus sciuri]
MDKDILNYLDQVGQYIQGASEKGFETYVHGVFVSSVIYSIVGVVLLIIATILCVISWKLYKKEVYYTVPEREAYRYFGETKTIPEHQERDSEAEEINLYVSLIIIVVSLLLFISGTFFVISSITGIFAPDYVAIKEIVKGITNK